MNIILLDKQQHDRQRFDCKNQVLNQYLNQIASQEAKKTMPEPMSSLIPSTLHGLWDFIH